jgi:16S rRNA (guanine527-N7)-methyltransferase
VKRATWGLVDLSTISALPPQALLKLEAYADLVRLWAPRLDLISPGDLAALESRHLEDSLKALPVVESLPPGPSIDVGSGAGLPGIPLAIATSRRWRLLERRTKRAGFLEEAIRSLELDAEVIVATAMEAAADPEFRGAHVVATARALAAPKEALELCRPLVAPGGSVLLWLGKQAKLPPDSEESVEGLASIRIEDR